MGQWVGRQSRRNQWCWTEKEKKRMKKKYTLRPLGQYQV